MAEIILNFMGNLLLIGIRDRRDEVAGGKVNR
jgi:hypothetical protein